MNPVCLQCLDLGKMVLDSKFDDEVNMYDNSDEGRVKRKRG